MNSQGLLPFRNAGVNQFGTYGVQGQQKKGCYEACRAHRAHAKSAESDHVISSEMEVCAQTRLRRAAIQ